MKNHRRYSTYRIQRIVLWVVCLLLPTYTLFSQLNNSDQAATKNLDGKTISLVELLKDIQEHTGYSFIFDESLIADKTIFVPSTTLSKFNQKLVNEIGKQSGLDFKQITPTTFVIKEYIRDAVTLRGQVLDKQKNPLIGANLVLEELNRGFTTDENGQFEIIIPRGIHTVSCSYIGYESFRQVIEVTGASDVQLPIQFKTHLRLEEIVVVGNRFLPKSLQESAVPIDVVEKEQVQQSLQTDLSQLLQYETPSFHSTHQTISDGTDHVDPISIKGLGPDQVLVLVNGKRRHFSSLVNINGTVGRGSVGVDLNAIPIAAVKKIEVLKDGAAAQYGSDAIAGVINVVLKNDVNKGSVDFTSGITQEGDGKQLSLSAHYGLKTLERGHSNLTFYFQTREGVNRSGPYNGTIYGDDRDKDPVAVQRFFEETGYGNNRVMTAGNSAITNTGLYFNAALPFSKSIEGYVFSNFNYRLGKAGGFYRFPYQEPKQSGLYPNGFSPKIHSDIFDFSIVGGIRSNRAGWHVDISNNLGRNSFDFNIKNSNNASLGLNSPSATYSGGFSYMHNITSVDIAKKQIFELPINIAFGSEFRLEQYRQKEGEEVSWGHFGARTSIGEPKEAGFQIFPGFRPENQTNKYRYNAGLYADAEASISPKWLVGLAGRYENYSDFGSNFSWKFSSRYRITPSFTLRSTYNTGFRAPSLPQSFFSSHSLQFLPIGGEILSSEVAHENHESAIVARLQIPNLKPEISNNISIGIANSLKNWRFTVDAYQINIKDRIVLSGQISPKARDELFAILNSSNVDRVQFFNNAVNTTTKGIDLTAKYKKQWNNQRFSIFSGLNINQTKVTKSIPPTPILANYKDDIFTREEVARLEKAQPNSKIILAANYHINKFQIGLSTTRFGQVQYIHPMDGHPENWVLNDYNGLTETRDQIFSSKWITDLELSLNIFSKLRSTLAIYNIANIYPDQHQHAANTNNGVLAYSRRVQQFGVKGRQYLLKLSYTL